MPSKDTFREKRPELNESLSSELERQNATSAPGRGRAGSQTERREVSGQLLRLAKRLGKDPDELAAKIPADTLRRTKYPVLEQIDEDGRVTFKHDAGIITEGLISLIRK
jgi:hypothetical protein